jgi:hypothetical protein
MQYRPCFCGFGQACKAVLGLLTGQAQRPIRRSSGWGFPNHPDITSVVAKNRALIALFLWIQTAPNLR